MQTRSGLTLKRKSSTRQDPSQTPKRRINRKRPHRVPKAPIPGTLEQASPFLHLPNELLKQVLDYVFADARIEYHRPLQDDNLTYQSPHAEASSHHKVLLTCKEFYQRYLHLYYTVTTAVVVDYHSSAMLRSTMARNVKTNIGRLIFTERALPPMSLAVPLFQELPALKLVESILPPIGLRTAKVNRMSDDELLRLIKREDYWTGWDNLYADRETASRYTFKYLVRHEVVYDDEDILGCLEHMVSTVTAKDAFPS